MDISVQCYADGSMTEDFTEGFDIKTQLNAPGCKSMPQDMIIDRCNPCIFSVFGESNSEEYEVPYSGSVPVRI